MKKQEKAKMKFFDKRDWYILHFLLTVIVAIVLAINCAALWVINESRMSDIENSTNLHINLMNKINELNRRVEKLEKK